MLWYSKSKMIPQQPCVDKYGANICHLQRFHLGQSFDVGGDRRPRRRPGTKPSGQDPDGKPAGKPSSGEASPKPPKKPPTPPQDPTKPPPPPRQASNEATGHKTQRQAFTAVCASSTSHTHVHWLSPSPTKACAIQQIHRRVDARCASTCTVDRGRLSHEGGV